MTTITGLGACGPSSPDAAQACTMIGCESGLTVRLAEGLGEPLSVEVSGAGEPTRTVRCGSDQPCEGGVFFRDFLPESVTIRVRTAAGTTTSAARPRYRSVQPNGEGCPPTCRQGEVLVSGADPAEPAPEPPSSSRPASIVDTVRIEGMPEPMPMRLVRPDNAFPLPFTTYAPEDWRTEATSSGEGPGFRMMPGPTWMEGGLMLVMVHPEGTTRSEASSLVRSAATTGGGEVEPLAEPDPWALEAHRFRRPGDPGARITGWVELGRRDGRFFHVLVRYPEEMGDGMAPRVGAIMRHWRWEPSGDPLGG